MSERTSTTVKTEYKGGKKIVTTITVVTTEDDRFAENQLNKDPARVLSRTKQEMKVSPSTFNASESFGKEALEKHNYYRAKHGVAPLEWCSWCSAHAQRHADYMARTGRFEHSSNRAFGECIYVMKNSMGISASEAVEAWYGEVKKMRFGESTPHNLTSVAHFTQIVWKDTSRVGMAYAIRGSTTFIVANYFSPGNLRGEFHKQVLPPTD